MGKQKSKQAIADGKIIKILQDNTSTNREKQRAFDKLYEKHERQVLTFFIKNGKSVELAKDLKMITFEKVYENIDKYKKDTAVFSTWIYKIALHTMIDEKRKNKYNILSLDKLIDKNLSDNEIKLQIESTIQNPEQSLIKHEKIQRIHDTIDLIDNPIVKKLMKYRFIDDMSFKNIAKKLGVKNNSTLRVAVKRETKNIAEELQ